MSDRPTARAMDLAAFTRGVLGELVEQFRPGRECPAKLERSLGRRIAVCLQVLHECTTNAGRVPDECRTDEIGAWKATPSKRGGGGGGVSGLSEASSKASHALVAQIG